MRAKKGQTLETIAKLVRSTLHMLRGDIVFVSNQAIRDVRLSLWKPFLIVLQLPLFKYYIIISRNNPCPDMRKNANIMPQDSMVRKNNALNGDKGHLKGGG
jgi:hypothetical protein